MSTSRDPRLWEPPEPEPRRITLWMRMAHGQGTCGGPDAECPLCCAPEPAA